MPDWKARLHSAFRAAGKDCDIDVLEELSTHASNAYERLRADGANAGDAERRVDDLIGTFVRDAAGLTRPSRRLPAVPPPASGTSQLTGALHDVRYAWRLLRRQPGFAGIAVLTMALGIGATTLLFSVAYGVLLQPLPWANASELVRITETRQGRTGRIPGTVSNGTFRSWREHHTTVEDLGGWLTQTSTLTGAGDPVRVAVIPTTPSLFRLLRVKPMLGRLFDESEGDNDQPGVAILSHGLWQERFGSRTDIVGQLLRLNDRAYTVVGVMPRDFEFPDREGRVWTAWTVPPVNGANGMLAGVIFRAVARLRPGVSPAQASAEATAAARSAPDMGMAARALFGASTEPAVSVVPELEAVTAEVKPAILILLAAVVLLLMTATANVASLQLARATVRRREIAVRSAIGAGQGHIARQLLIENGILGLLGGIGGLALAATLQQLLPAILPAGFPRLDAISLDLRALFVALGVSVLASVACGLLPAWHARRVNLTDILTEDGVGAVSGAARTPAARTRAVIMSGQVAIACLLLVGATLLTRSFLASVHAERGYDPVNVLTARLPMPAAFPAEQRTTLLDTIVERLRNTPGISHVAYSSGLPLLSAGGFSAFNMRSPVRPETQIEVQATQRLVSPAYFGAMRLRVVEGRALADTDTASSAPVVVVNRTFARQYLGDHPLDVRLPSYGARAGGVRFAIADADARVVGVVDDMRQDALDAPPQPEIFASIAQLQPASLRNFDPILVVRTDDDPASHVAMLRAIVHEQAPAMALDSVMTMEDRVMTSLAKPRLYAIVLSWFGLFALLVAGVGLFGVLSFSVAQRTREIGVRSALGAQPADIIGLVLRQAMWIVGAGVAVGLGAAAAGTRAIRAFLYGVGTHDVLTFAGVAVLILAVAAVACILPARRASKVDPLTALRT